MEKQKAKGPRASVSAEAFGAFNKKEDFKPKVIQKDESVKQSILEKIDQAFMFSGLDSNEKKIVIDAMWEKNAID